MGFQERYRLSEEESKEGFELLFDGSGLDHWSGNIAGYQTEDGVIYADPECETSGNLFTRKEYGDFIFRFDFKLTPGANSGVGIRTPKNVDPAYGGMEIQILDCEHPMYHDINMYQHHGAVYGILPVKPDHAEAFNPICEWNSEEIRAIGDNIRVTVNGVVIMEGNIRTAVKNGTPDGHKHEGLFNKRGFIGFLGHGSPLWLRNIRIKGL